MRILRQKVLRACMDIGEVTASAARNTDLVTGLSRVIQHHHRTAALCGLDRTHHASSASAYHQNIDALQHSTPI